MKFCEVGQHEVKVLWRSRKTNRETNEVSPSCCKNCMSKTPIKSKVKKEKDQELEVFFASQSLVMPELCENCGERLDLSTLFSRKAQTCHILPKSLYKSVKSHPQNKLFMCCFHGCHGHGNWDNLDSTKRKSMDVYELAIKRFRMFENTLSEQELIKAYKYLGLEG